MNLLGRLFYGKAREAFDGDYPRDWLGEAEAAVMGTLLGVVAVLFLWAYGRTR